jgi:hypothetical protein
MVKNVINITCISAGVGYRELQLKYDAEDRVLENKNGLWIHKGHQGLLYSR